MENEDDEGAVWGRKSNISLLDQHTELKKLAEGKNEAKKFNQKQLLRVVYVICYSKERECHGKAA
jgi:hypothetical protein